MAGEIERRRQKKKNPGQSRGFSGRRATCTTGRKLLGLLLVLLVAALGLLALLALLLLLGAIGRGSILRLRDRPRGRHENGEGEENGTRELHRLSPSWVA